MLYRLLKLLVGISIRMYYSEIKIRNKKYLQHNGPMLIIANHPNTLMDAWMVGHVCPQPIYYMAKGTFFNSPLKKKILSSLNMIPINRKSDKAVTGINNKDSFEACYQILGEGKTLVIFPEGSSFPERQLRELKSGAARIALEAEKRHGGKLNLKVVPMGLFYSRAEKFRSKVLVTLEQGIMVNEYLPMYEQNSSQAARKLTEKFRIHLERVLVVTESKEQEQLMQDLFTILSADQKELDVEDDARLMNSIKAKLEEIQLLKPYLLKEIQELVHAIMWQSKKLKIHADFIHRRFRSRLYLMQVGLSLVFLLIGFPLFAFGMIHNFPAYLLVDKLVPRLTKYVEYYAPLNVLMSLIIYPVYYFLFLMLAHYGFEFNWWQELVYLLLMPLTGMYAYKFMGFLSRINYKWKYIFLIFNQREAIMHLQELQKRLEKLMHE